ncbi:MAG: response regulator [Bacteroidota bacterium]|nr:response regulator [Bacteroidota bacterium]
MEQITILIIDDGDDLFRFCRQFMQGTYSIVHARTGHEGLKILETEVVKLIILDKSFDRINKGELFSGDADNEGLEILRVLQQLYPQIPVMMVTAHADKNSRQKALFLGAVEYFSWENICTDIDTMLTSTKRVINSGVM